MCWQKVSVYVHCRYSRTYRLLPVAGVSSPVVGGTRLETMPSNSFTRLANASLSLVTASLLLSSSAFSSVKRSISSAASASAALEVALRRICSATRFSRFSILSAAFSMNDLWNMCGRSAIAARSWSAVPKPMFSAIRLSRCDQSKTSFRRPSLE